MANPFFRFRQFSVYQNRCAMKVSTDACLFGAWAPFPQGIKTILDIGAGTGLLSLMLAQRFADAHITALEIDPEAASQAAENFAGSPFSERLQLVAGDVLTYQPAQLFDAIICNPPFFQNSLQGPDAQRNQARHTDTLPFGNLHEKIGTLLQPNGLSGLMLPVTAQKQWTEASRAGDLHLHEQLIVRPLPGKAPNRVLSLYGKAQPFENPTAAEMAIYSQYGQYTTESAALLKPFYLRL